MHYRRLVLIVAVTVCGVQASYGQYEPGEQAKLLRGTKDNADVAEGLCLEEDEIIVGPALAAYIAGNEADSVDACKFYLKVARRKGLFGKVAATLSISKGTDRVPGVLAKMNQSDANALAAAILYLKAKGNYIVDEVDSQNLLREHDNAGGGKVNVKRKGKGKGGKGKGKGRQSRDRDVDEIPASLLTDKSPTTVHFAVLAAAYATDKSVADAIAEIKPRSGDIAGAKALYSAMTGTQLSKDEAIKLYSQVQRVSKAIASVQPTLSTFDSPEPGACSLATACAKSGNAELLPVIHKLATNPDLRVQQDAVRAIRVFGSEKSVPTLLKLLEKCSWPVLVEVTAALAEIPHKESLKPLIMRLDREQGRFRLDCTHALSCIAGEQVGQTADEWAGWYKTNYKSFNVNRDASETYRKSKRKQDVQVPGLGYFYGLSIFSNRFSYVVDTSASMKGARIYSLRQNMHESIDSLTKVVQFNIVDFGGDVISFYDRALTNNKRKAKERVTNMPLTGGTRSYDALEEACQLSSVDTLYFLSDGAPIRGQFNPWSEITRALMIYNRYRPIAVFMIDFDPSAGNQMWMMQFSDEFVGMHESIDIQEGDGVEEKKKKKKK